MCIYIFFVLASNSLFKKISTTYAHARAGPQQGLSRADNGCWVVGWRGQGNIARARASACSRVDLVRRFTRHERERDSEGSALTSRRVRYARGGGKRDTLRAVESSRVYAYRVRTCVCRTEGSGVTSVRRVRSDFRRTADIHEESRLDQMIGPGKDVRPVESWASEWRPSTFSCFENVGFGLCLWDIRLVWRDEVFYVNGCTSNSSRSDGLDSVETFPLGSRDVWGSRRSGVG